MSGRLRSWRKLPVGDQLRVVEAAAWLAGAWVIVRLLPFRAYAFVLGRPSAPGQPDATPAPADAACARNVGLGLRRASRHLPWHSTCLMQVVAGSLMLRLRRRRGRAYVGAAKREGSLDGFEFHAWLIAGGVPVCGVHEGKRFTTLAAFH